MGYPAPERLRYHSTPGVIVEVVLIGVLVVVGLVAAIWWVMGDYLMSEDKSRFRTRQTREQRREERLRRAAEWNRADRERREQPWWKGEGGE